jgi:arginyl-tRNA synthetase
VSPLPANAVSRLGNKVAELAGAPVELERPSDPAHGDYATNVALPVAKERRRPPRELAEEIAAAVVGLPEVERAEVAGPGFVNLWVSDAFLSEVLAEIGPDFGGGSAERRERIQVELVSANPTGPVTVASARNGAYGDSVARLLEFAGHAVVREYYYNDAGTQMERFRASVEAARRGEEPPEEGYRGAYIKELAKLEGDPVPPMLEQIAATLERFRIHFDSWARQSELEQRIPETLAQLDTYEADGAVWVRSSAHGDEKDRVVIRSPERGGLPTYEAADAVYLREKLERGYDHVIYVLGADHHFYVRWLKSLAHAMGYDPERVEVLLYQFVHLTRGGEATKISKRAGDVVFLDELVDEIGVDAARWYLVNRGPDQTIEIDVDLAAEKTQKNPVYYVQYAHARISGILRNAGDASGVGSTEPPKSGGAGFAGAVAGSSASFAAPLEKEERDLIKRLAEFAPIVGEATERRAPQAIPTYAIRVADDFHRFYHEHRVLGSGDAQPFRLGLVRATQAVIARCLDLIGVEAPERM